MLAQVNSVLLMLLRICLAGGHWQGAAGLTGCHIRLLSLIHTNPLRGKTLCTELVAGLSKLGSIQ